jgi:hypothetical protein
MKINNLLVSCLLALTVTTANAADPGSVSDRYETSSSGQKIRDGIERRKSVFTRQRAGEDPITIRVGSFQASPYIGVGTSYDDNVFLADEDIRDNNGNSLERESFVFHLNPEIELASNWSRHQLNFRGGFNMARYLEEEEQNFADTLLAVDGVLNVTDTLDLFAGAVYRRLHENAAAPNSGSSALGEPIDYDTKTLTFGISQELGRFGYSATGVYRTWDYDDSENSLGVDTNHDDRDRDDSLGELEFYYTPSPGYKVFTRFIADYRDYDDRVDDNNRNRDSGGQQLLVGSELEIGANIIGEAYIGYARRDYERSAFDDAREFVYGLDLLWNITDSSSLLFDANRQVVDATLINSPYLVADLYGVRYEQEITRKFLVAADVKHTSYEYKQSSVEDDLYSAAIELRYSITENTEAFADYTYNTRDSGIADSDYDQNVTTLGLTFRND